MHKSQENLPCNNASQYIQEQKEAYDLPLHKSGIELAASIANITTSAELIAKETLNYNPEVFDENEFEKQRISLIKSTPEKKQAFLNQLSLHLSREGKDDLELLIENFLYDFKMHFNNNIFNACRDIQEDEEDFGYLIFEDSLYQLLEPEVAIQNVYDSYLNLTNFLVSTGIQPEAFEEIFELMEKENNIKYTTH